jgi:hypothetical protein
MKNFFLPLLTLALLTPSLGFINAQSLQSLSGQTNSLVIETDPVRPEPNQTVTVSIESYATDLSRSTISWYLNNVLTKEGTGLKQFTFKTGRAGSVSNILIVVKTSEGALLQETLNIHPASLDLVWEAQSYTPPFYKGKAFYPYQGTVKVVAMPNNCNRYTGRDSSNCCLHLDRSYHIDHG